MLISRYQIAELADVLGVLLLGVLHLEGDALPIDAQLILRETPE